MPYLILLRYYLVSFTILVSTAFSQSEFSTTAKYDYNNGQSVTTTGSSVEVNTYSTATESSGLSTFGIGPSTSTLTTISNFHSLGTSSQANGLRTEFDKSTTPKPSTMSSFGTKGQALSGGQRSTSGVAAVYEDTGAEDEDGTGVPLGGTRQATDASFMINSGVGPIYVSMDGHKGNGQSKPNEICDFCIYEGEGNFTSYGYPLPYRNHLNCSYRIQRVDSSDVCELELIFHDFDIPVSSGQDNNDAEGSKKDSMGSNECKEDYLEVYGRRFCGSGWTGKTEMVPFPAAQREVTFRFISNDKGSGRGFWVEVRRKQGTCYGKKPVQLCEERFAEFDFVLMSPHFPNEYPSNSECTYYIRRASNDVCGLEITFLQFDLESVNGCFYDYVEIEGQKFCGFLPTDTMKVISFSEDQKVITFHSDKQISKSGFQIRIRQLTQCITTNRLPPPPSCNVCTNDFTGILVSYNYPNYYRNNLLCSYTIEKNAPNICSIELYFQDFDVVPSIDCVDDYLQIGQKRYCGTTLHSRKQTLNFGNNNALNMVFKTDDVAVNKGFNIKYQQVPCSSSETKGGKSVSPKKEPSSPKDECSYIFTEKFFMIRSENYSKNYPNNIDCNYFIKKNTSRVCYLELTFVKFDVEASPQCQFDYFEINNVRLCGSLQKETTRTYLFDEREKIAKFHSDSSTNREGYLIRAEQLECQGDVIVRTTTGTPPLPTDTQLSSTVAPPPPPLLPPVRSQPPSQQPLPHPPRHQPPQTPSSSSSLCNQNFSSYEFEIQSPQYSSKYPSSTDCLFIIEKVSPTVCRLEVTYYEFSMQQPDLSGYCKFDYLDFNGIRMCGEVSKNSVRSYYFPESVFMVRFHSDSLSTPKDRGFRLGVRQGECGTNIIGGIGGGGGPSQVPGQSPNDLQPFKCDQVFNDVTFEVRSPGFPDRYPTNLNCRYTVIKKESHIPICQLEVHYVDVVLDEDADCSADFLDFDGKRVCGSQPPDATEFFPFERSEFVIHFKSDSVDSGFLKTRYHLQVRQRECPDGFSVPPEVPQKPGSSKGGHQPPKDNRPSIHGQDPKRKTDGCHQVISEKHFALISPRYPQSYESNLDCTYLIRKASSKVCRLDLVFVDFNLEEGPECGFDFLSIDGMKICGKFKANSVRSFTFTDSAEKLILFHSDPARNKGGFYIRGQQKDCDDLLPAPDTGDEQKSEDGSQHPVMKPGQVNNGHPSSAHLPPSICEVCYAENAGEIKSYQFPNNYPNNLNCNYRITGLPDYCSVYLKFDEFSLEDPGTDNQCHNDYLEIDGHRYCGQQLLGMKKIVHFKGRPKEVLIHFVTNAHTNGKGFRGSYTQFPCTEQNQDRSPASNTMSSHPVPGLITTGVTGSGPISVVQSQDQNRDTNSGIFQVSKVPRVPCDVVIFNKKFDLKSPGYPSKYAPNVDCLYSIRRINPSVCKIQLNFIDFDTDSSSGCANDYLEVLGMKLCGSFNNTIREFDFTGYKFVLRFRSDATNSARGFFIAGEQLECTQNGYPMVAPAYNKPTIELPAYPSHYPTVQDQSIYHQMPEADPSTVVNTYSKPHSTYFQAEPPYSLNMSPSYSRTSGRHSGGSLSSNSVPVHVSSAGSSYVPIASSSLSSASSAVSVAGSPHYVPYTPVTYPKSGSQRTIPELSYPPGYISSPSTPLSPSTAPGYSSPSFSSLSSASESACNKIINETFFDIKSPNFPYRYPSGSRCMYVISKAKPNVCQLDLMFVSFEVGGQTDHSPSCTRDFLSIDGDRVCGLLPKDQVKSYRFDLVEKYVYFKGDLGEGQGFAIRGRQVECETQPPPPPTPFLGRENRRNVLIESKSDFIEDVSFDRSSNFGTSSKHLPYCDQTISESEFTLTSPGYPYIYPNNLYCRYYIKRASGSICGLNFKFNTFDLESDHIGNNISSNHNDNKFGVLKGVECKKDYLEIDGTKLCGHLPPGHERRYYFNSPDENEKTLVFRTDNSGSKSGFSVQIKHITDCGHKDLKPASSDSNCEVKTGEVSGYLTSTGYPQSYENGAKCLYQIFAANPNYCSLKLQIEDLDIETSLGCKKDYLYLANQRICNSNHASNQLTLYFPENEPRTVQFSFYSDNFNTGRGFYISYLQELCSGKSNFGHSDVGAPNSPPSKSRTRLIDPFAELGSGNVQYPPNYVAKATIEEIVETRVKVLEPTPSPKAPDGSPIRTVTINVQPPSRFSKYYKSQETVSN